MAGTTWPGCPTAEGFPLRIASNNDLSPAVACFAEVQPRLAGYRSDLLGHLTAGRSLRNYLILTESLDLLAGLGLTEGRLFWSRYYWLARFAREWQAAIGFDAGLEQQVLQLLEQASVDYDPLPEVDAAVERDAVLPSPD